MKRVAYILALLVVIAASCKKDNHWVPDGYTSGTYEIPSGNYVSDQGFKMVAYYSEGREPDSIAMEKFKLITHLHYAFAYPNIDGTIKAIAQPARFDTIMNRARANGVKVAVSFAGSESIFSAIAADPELRTKLVKNIVNFALKNNLDGIDIDWEYPRSNKANNITFELFMKELGAGLHTYHKYLSAAVTAGLYEGSVKEGVTKEAIDAIDFINLMAYDGANWAGDPNHSSYQLAEDVLDVWLNEKGLPKEKAVLGIPVYGKNSQNSAIIYRDLLASGADPEANSFSVNGSVYHYNGKALVRQKANLSKSRANGLMFWEFYQDVNGEESLLKNAADALGRAN